MWDVCEQTDFYHSFQDQECTFLVDSQLCIHFWRGLNSISWLFTSCIINSRLHTPLSPLISHRCQKEACTEIKGRIWALCSKIKLSVVIFYITFRTAYWKMFPLLVLLPPLLLFLPHPSFFSLSSFSSLCICHHKFPFPVQWVGIVTVSMQSATINNDYLDSDKSQGVMVQIYLQTLKTQHNGPHFQHKRILHICICNVTAVDPECVCGPPAPHTHTFFKRQKSEPRHLLTAVPISDTHPGVQYLVDQSIQQQIVSVPVPGTVGRDKLICQPQVSQTNY